MIADLVFGRQDACHHQRHANCSSWSWLSLSQVAAWLRSSLNGATGFGFPAISVVVSPLTVGVSGRAKNAGSPGGFVATG